MTHRIVLSLAVLSLLSAAAGSMVSATEMKSRPAPAAKTKEKGWIEIESYSSGSAAATKPKEIVVVGGKSGQQTGPKGAQPDKLTGEQPKQRAGLIVPAIQKIREPAARMGGGTKSKK